MHLQKCLTFGVHIRNNYYIVQQSFYHRSRACRFIINKENVIECSVKDIPVGKLKCTECFKNNRANR